MSTYQLTPDTGKDKRECRDGRAQARRIQTVLDRIHSEGGGTLELAAGDWLCATIRLRSQVELHLERGCRLIADPDLSHYSPVSHRFGGGPRTVAAACFWLRIVSRQP